MSTMQMREALPARASAGMFSDAWRRAGRPEPVALESDDACTVAHEDAETVRQYPHVAQVRSRARLSWADAAVVTFFAALLAAFTLFSADSPSRANVPETLARVEAACEMRTANMDRPLTEDRFWRTACGPSVPLN
jgi:hypothetical protein